VHVTTPQAATALGIATVYQDLALCDNLDVVANLWLGREELGAVRLLDETDMEQEASKVLKRLAVRIPSVRTQVASLSGGQRQSVAIARSMLGEPRMVILDEPTAALGVAQTAQVLDLIRRLREQGLAVVVISHNLADVFAVADTIVVLRLGKQVGVIDAKQTNSEEVVAAITGAKAGDEQPTEVTEP
jgi:D-xylose transport system ATP-binding protein